MALNDHRALTAERRNQLDDTAAAIAMLLLRDPNDEQITNLHRAFVEAMSHVEALDARAHNLATIFRNLQDYTDRLGSAPEGAVTDANAVGAHLNYLIQEALASL